MWGWKSALANAHEFTTEEAVRKWNVYYDDSAMKERERKESMISIFANTHIIGMQSYPCVLHWTLAVVCSSLKLIYAMQYFKEWEIDK